MLGIVSKYHYLVSRNLVSALIPDLMVLNSNYNLVACVNTW